MEKEIWKDIVGYEGLYQASDMGNIKSLYRDKGKIKSRLRFYKEIILKPYTNNAGYYIVCLRNGTRGKKFLVHRLVAMTFLGESNLNIDHINAIKTDNRLSNLRYCTQRENMSYYIMTQPKSSQYVGVTKLKKVYNNNFFAASIKIKGKSFCLGTFNTEYEAHLCYQNKLKEIGS